MYYIYFNNQVVGPMSADQIFAYPVNANTQVSTDGQNWAALFQFPELMQRLNHQGGYGTARNDMESKKTVFGILAILLGGLGIQYFYIGKTSAGFITILLTIITCGLWEIVTLIQGILALCMSDYDFRQKYQDTTKTFPLF